MKLDFLAEGSEILYCCKKCALRDGVKGGEYVDLTEDPDDAAEEYGQLCPVCEEMYHFTDAF